jgi:hypothetical protein
MLMKMEIRVIQGSATLAVQIVFDVQKVDDRVQPLAAPKVITEKTETRGGVFYGPFEGVFDVEEKTKKDQPKTEQKPIEDPAPEIIVEAPS